MVFVQKGVVKYNYSHSAMNCSATYNIGAGILSGPVAFVGSRFLRSFSEPNMVIFISGID
jgi:hypothetical protein